MATEMTPDTWLGIYGLAVGVVGVAATVAFGVLGVIVAVWAVCDARRQRSKREKAVIAAHAVIERTYGLLIAIKPSVVSLGPGHVAAVDDGLQAINQQRAVLDHL